MPALEPIVITGMKHVGSNPRSPRPVTSVDTNKPPSPYYFSSPELFETPVLTENQIPIVPPTAPQPDRDEGAQLEGLGDNTAEVPDARPPVVPPVFIKDPPTVSPAVPPPRPCKGANFEGLGDTAEVLDAPLPLDPITGVSCEGWDNVLEPHWLSVTLLRETLREIKQRLEQAIMGEIKRIPHPDRLFISLSIPRLAMRLLMSSASLVPSAFASHSGFLGPVESTPYYPTGDSSFHRDISFSMAMGCIDHLEGHISVGDDVRTVTKLVALAQALSDLGLYDYALSISGLALDALQHPYATKHNNACLHIASVLCLRANILCDLRKNHEANDAAERAVMLCREHKNSQTAPVPELLLNYAVILNATDLKDHSAAVALELLGELDESRPETKDILALCKLCISTSCIGADDDMAQYMADETIDSSRMSWDTNSQTILASALLAKSKVLSSKNQATAALTVGAEAVTLFRYMSMTRPVFSLFLAHALDTHAHHLSEAYKKGESYSVRQDAIEHWQTLKVTAGGGVVRPLARSLFELAKLRLKDADRQTLREECRIIESAIEMFRETEPLDTTGLGDALYLYAGRMLELDKNQEAATYAEESVVYLREAASKNPVYALGLVFSLSLASACLACTTLADTAFEYAKQAVEVQRSRQHVEYPQYDGHLSKLLMQTVFRATEIDRTDEAASWYQEHQMLGVPGGTHQFFTSRSVISMT